MARIAAKGRTLEQAATSEQARRLLEAAIDALPTIYRTVFMLRQVEGRATAEVAECLGIREDAVKTRLVRARALLREELYTRAGVARADAFSFHLSRCSRLTARTLRQLGIAKDGVD